MNKKKMSTKNQKIKKITGAGNARGNGKKSKEISANEKKTRNTNKFKK